MYQLEETETKITMNPEVKEKWLAALRSGEIVQGQSRLTTVETRPDGESAIKHCCLGVLCAIAVEEGVITSEFKPWDENDTSFVGVGAGGRVYYDEDEVFALPPKVQEWAGLPTFGDNANYKHSLAQKNDEGWDFEQIAGIIESEL